MVKSIAISDHITPHKGWMAEGTQTLRSIVGMGFPCGVGGIHPKPHIAHQVAVGQGGEATVSKAGEGLLVVPPSDLSLSIMGALPNIAPIVALERIFKHRLQQAGIPQDRSLA